MECSDCHKFAIVDIKSSSIPVFHQIIVLYFSLYLYIEICDIIVK